MVRPKIPFFFWIIISAIIVLFFSYKILEVPMGLSADESAFGYNATLLSKTGRDENGRFMPVFVLSLKGQDWRQPVTQYYLTAFFKFFGPSVFNLRFSTVFITLASFFLLLFFSPIAALIFLLVPLVMIQTHMGLDNIMPIPFTIIWLIGLFQYTKTKNLKHLIYSAIALGISFYTYKGMRAVTPVWSILSCCYIFYLNQYSFKKLKPIIIFSLAIFPFYLAIPFLNVKYPGSILGGSQPKITNIYEFIYPYLSSFDPTFLFIKGDSTPFHSTNRHGMYLLATLPLFFLGIYNLIKKNDKFYNLILIAFFIGPILYGLIDSVHRASRLMCLIPLFCLITTHAVDYLIQNKHRLTIIVFFFLIIFNYVDFLIYYYGPYQKFTQNYFGTLEPYKSYKKLAKEAKNLNLTPYVDEDLVEKFFITIYFGPKPNILDKNQSPPLGSILMTNRDEVPTMKILPIKLKHYKLQTN